MSIEDPYPQESGAFGQGRILDKDREVFVLLNATGSPQRYMNNQSIFVIYTVQKLMNHV
jgi:hypothetical protein